MQLGAGRPAWAGSGCLKHNPGLAWILISYFYWLEQNVRMSFGFSNFSKLWNWTTSSLYLTCLSELNHAYRLYMEFWLIHSYITIKVKTKNIQFLFHKHLIVMLVQWPKLGYHLQITGSFTGNPSFLYELHNQHDMALNSKGLYGKFYKTSMEEVKSEDSQ